MNTDGELFGVVLLVTQTLLHFVWQGAALGAVAVILSIALRHRTQAQAWWTSQLAVFALMLLCPLTTIAFLLSAVDSGDLQPLSLPLSTQLSTSESQGGIDTSESPESIALPVLPAPRANEPVDFSVVTPPVPNDNRGRLERAAPLVSALYTIGLIVMLLRLLIGVRGGRRLRTSAEAIADTVLLAMIETCARGLRLRRAPAVALSTRVAVATVVGFIRPVVLLPVHIQTGFTPAQVEMLLLHEFAHLRRYDHWVALLQRLGEALLFFHPAVWYVSRQISAAREHCCDDLVLGLGKTPVDYAKALLCAGEQATRDPNPVLAALHAVKAPSQLRRRIARMLRSELPVKAAPSRLTMFLVVTLIAGSVIAVAATTQNETQDPAPQELAETVAEPIEPESASAEEPPIVIAQNTTQAEPQPANPALVAEHEATAQRTEQLLQQLASGDPWVSKLAALEMGRSGNRFYVNPLTQLLSQETAPPEARAAAAEALGTLADPRGVPYLVSALRYFGSTSSSIATAAEQALAKIKDDSVLTTLKVAVADENTQLRAGAYSTLAHIGTPEAYHLLASAGLRDTTDAAPFAAEQLARAAKEATNADKRGVLFAALTTGDPVMSERAMLALVKLGTDEANKAVTQALEAGTVVPTEWTISNILRSPLIEQSDVCRALTNLLMTGKLNALGTSSRATLGEKIIASGNLPDSSDAQAALYVATGNYSISPSFGTAAVKPLLTALESTNESDPNQRSYIVAALGEIGDPSALEALERELGRGYSDEHSQYVIQTIGKIGSDAAQPMLIRALKHRHAKVRAQAASQLAAYKNDASIDALVLALRDLDELVRSMAAQALGKIGSRRAIPALIPMFQDLSDDVKVHAGNAVARIGGDEALNALVGLLDTDGREELRMALAALKILGDPRAIPALQALIQRQRARNTDVASDAFGLQQYLESLPPR
jgi:HEAT repeat protein/beta-lactamase regulating signal transducer with metallopeptidase domain